MLCWAERQRSEVIGHFKDVHQSQGRCREHLKAAPEGILLSNLHNLIIPICCRHCALPHSQECSLFIAFLKFTHCMTLVEKSLDWYFPTHPPTQHNTDKIVESYSLSRQDLERFSFDLWSQLIQNVDILYFEQGSKAVNDSVIPCLQRFPTDWGWKLWKSATDFSFRCF